MNAIEYFQDRVQSCADRLERVAAFERGIDVGAAETSASTALVVAAREAHLRRDASLPEARLRAMGLTPTECDVIWLLAMSATRPEPRGFVLEHIHRLVYENQPLLAYRELSPTSPLIAWALIERADGGGTATHETLRTYTLSRRMIAFLYGCEDLGADVNAMHRERDPLTANAIVGDHDGGGIARMLSGHRNHVIVVSGLPHLGKRSLLRAAASQAGLQVLELDATRLAKDVTALEKELRAIVRDCRLLGRVPLIGNLDALDDERMNLVRDQLVAFLDGTILVTTGAQRPRLDWGRPVVLVDMRQPTSAQRASLWKKELGEIGAHDVEHLATHYPLAPALIARAAEAAKARAGERPLTAEDVHAGIRAVLDDRVGQFAKRVTVTQTWDDLVLPQEQVDSITELMARIRERRRVYEDWGFAAKVGKGLGTSALFSGPPGTGKTMVAALIARDLGLELYQVDLGKVVSKYIGETEKNLAALFDAAEAGHAVILFDEADALFGKRTDVKSSNDRYANLETNYLLQRLETFAGICLLTSNHESNIDPAFLRRLSLHLRFDLPDVAERAQLWRAMMPSAAPVDGDVDLHGLAQRYAMSGGYIRNATLRAAFLAANEDSAITGAHLERAARREYEAMGKIATS